MTPSLKEHNLYRSDPIASLLVKKLNISPLRAGLWSIAIGVVFMLAAALVSQTLVSKTGYKGLLQDPIPWIAVIVINPFVVGYYLWSFQAISSVIENLDKSDVVEINKLKIEQKCSTVYHRRWRNLVAVGSAISFGIIVFTTQPSFKDSWASSGLVPNLIISIATVIVVYMGSMLILNLINNIQILNTILKEKNLNINPLHPDRCGGLKCLSDYSLKTAYLIAILGVWIGVIGYQTITQGSEQDYWYICLIVFLYIGLSLACFFGPLVTAHKGMEKEKNNFLHNIARQFQGDYLQIHNSSIKIEDPETLKKRIEKVRELRSFYTITDEFPVWPFNIQTFRRYLLSVTTPLLSLIVAVLKKYLETLIK